MRIIAGSLRGRQFVAPPGNRTHPMSERVRGGLFNVLGDIGGLSVLDPFAGSGALSFEALSRGAALAVALESDRAAQLTIAANAAALGVGTTLKLVRASADAWLRTSPPRLFDLLLCDPPYDHPPLTLLERLADRLGPGGVYVLSWPPGRALPSLPGLQPGVTKPYGDAQLHFYTKPPA